MSTPPPNPMSMLPAAIACCRRAPPPNAATSSSRPYFLKMPCLMPRSIIENENDFGTALPTRRVSAVAAEKRAMLAAATSTRSRPQRAARCKIAIPECILLFAIDHQVGPAGQEVRKIAVELPEGVFGVAIICPGDMRRHDRSGRPPPRAVRRQRLGLGR